MTWEKVKERRILNEYIHTLLRLQAPLGMESYRNLITKLTNLSILLKGFVLSIIKGFDGAFNGIIWINKTFYRDIKIWLFIRIVLQKDKSTYIINVPEVSLLSNLFIYGFIISRDFFKLLYIILNYKNVLKAHLILVIFMVFFFIWGIQYCYFIFSCLGETKTRVREAVSTTPKYFIAVDAVRSVCLRSVKVRYDMSNV